MGGMAAGRGICCDDGRSQEFKVWDVNQSDIAVHTYLPR
jgi:hypothetical protein